MTVGFNADEVLQIAEQIERNGARFYRTAAGQGYGDTVRAMLLDLADREISHLKTFSGLRQTLAESQPRPEVFDPQGETGLYLQALADRRVFDLTADPTEKLTGHDSLADVLKLALWAEKESIIFYLGVRDVVTDPADRGIVEEIVREEMRHVALLKAELDKAR